MPTAVAYESYNGPRRLRAVLMRSGTSKGLFLRREDLPEKREDWTPLILSAMGSPDPYLRQLNGVGGGTSTQSKVSVVGRCSDPTIADVDYTFVQVSVEKAMLDFSGNCGNMAAGCGPFAVTEGLVDLPSSAPKNSVTVRIRNPVEKGDMVISGVAGSGAPIRLDFMQPGRAMTGELLPTGQALDTLVVPSTEDHAELHIEASLVDSANPFCFIRASSLGLRGDELPSELGPHTPLVQEIRAVASVKMGLAPELESARQRLGVPKIAILAPASPYTTLSGSPVDDMDVLVRAYSNGTPHPAFQMSGAVCLASACSIPGSIPHAIVAERQATGPLRFAHPSGITTADHTVSLVDGKVTIVSGTVYRTCRRLMEGNVLLGL